MDDYAGNRRSRLQAFLDDLGFEWFGVRASLAHGNSGDKGDHVRLTLKCTLCPGLQGWVDDFSGRIPYSKRTAVHS